MGIHEPRMCIFYLTRSIFHGGFDFVGIPNQIDCYYWLIREKLCKIAKPNWHV